MNLGTGEVIVQNLKKVSIEGWASTASNSLGIVANELQASNRRGAANEVRRLQKELAAILKATA